MRSDQGTNFVGAKKELKEALGELDRDKIGKELLQNNCDWFCFKMNVPSAVTWEVSGNVRSEVSVMCFQCCLKTMEINLMMNPSVHSCAKQKLLSTVDPLRWMA